GPRTRRLATPRSLTIQQAPTIPAWAGRPCLTTQQVPATRQLVIWHSQITLVASVTLPWALLPEAVLLRRMGSFVSAPMVKTSARAALSAIFLARLLLEEFRSLSIQTVKWAALCLRSPSKRRSTP